MGSRSNLHQDYRITGENMMRSWVAVGNEPVDGVIRWTRGAGGRERHRADRHAAVRPDHRGQPRPEALLRGLQRDPVAQEQRKRSISS